MDLLTRKLVRANKLEPLMTQSCGSPMDKLQQNCAYLRQLRFSQPCKMLQNLSLTYEMWVGSFLQRALLRLDDNCWYPRLCQCEVGVGSLLLNMLSALVSAARAGDHGGGCDVDARAD